MIRAARLIAWPTLALSLLGFLLPSPVLAQNDQPNFQFLLGTQAFRYILNQRHFNPVLSADDAVREPRRTLIVVFGDTSVLDALPVRVADFVKDGGAVLLATDRGSPDQRADRSWQDQLGVQVVEQPVLAKSDRFCYQGYKECPFVLPVEADSTGLFEDLHAWVATNRAGFLRSHPAATGISLHVAAIFPPGCSSSRAEHPLEKVGFRLPFAVTGKWGDGRVLVLADHSVFINNMMLQRDTGNADFTFNCLDWLREGRVRRDRCLFYDDGQIVDDFNVPVRIPPPELPSIPDPVAFADQLIAGLEDENMHNRMLLDLIDFRDLVKWTALILTGALMVYGVHRIVRSRHRQDAGAPLLAPTLARLTPASSGLAARKQALLAEGNLWQPAQTLARDFFESALGASAAQYQTLPHFDIKENWLTRRALQKLIEHLWRLAYGSTPERVTSTAFAHLAVQVDNLHTALAEGNLRFETRTTT
jgi:hypothetical protein